MREVRLGALLVVLDGADVPAVGDADDDGHADSAPSCRFVILASCEVIWSNAGEDEPVELDLAHRPEPAHREPDRGADDAGLGERGVEHALLAELGLQPLGDAEDAAERADVLAHQQHAVVRRQRRAQPGVERRG